MKPVLRLEINRNWLQLGAYQVPCVSCERHFIAIASALLAILAALQIGSARNESVTNDELIHLTPGYVYLTTGEYSMELSAPPLGRVLAALPLLLMPIRHTPADRAWAEFDNFLWQNPASGQSILFRARLGVALVSKYSAIFLLLVLPLLYSIAWWNNRGRSVFTWRGAIVVFVVMCLGAGSVITLAFAPKAVTRFHELRAQGYRVPFFDRVFGLGAESTTRTSKMVAALGAAAAEPAYAYLTGLDHVLKHNADGHHAYLLGQFGRHGWWHYFPIAFLVKTPTAVLIAGLLALISLFWLRQRRDFGLLP